MPAGVSLHGPGETEPAQEILFGPTLESYLYGEQIGQTLVGKGSVEPLAVCTDVAGVLAVRDYVSLPVVLVLAGAEGDEAATETGATSANRTIPLRVDAAPPQRRPLADLCTRAESIALAAGRDADRQEVEARLANLATFNLREPFERIREAVEEVHKGRAA